MEPTSVVGYSATYPTRFAVKPRQPIAGKQVFSTIETFFTYDIITPYGYGAFIVSNPDTATQVFVGFGMIVHLAILCPGAATLTIQTDLVDGTYTEIDTSPIALAVSTKVQTIDIPILACYRIRGRLAGDGSTYTYHVSLTDY